jgi:hypothetical protein
VTSQRDYQLDRRQGFTPGEGGQKIRAKAREFNGTGSWREYRSHFERVCRLNGWNGHRLDYLWINLSSTAAAYAENLPRRRTRTYRDLVQAMEDRFGDSKMADIYKAELRNKKRKEGESLPALGQEVRRLVQYAYPGVGLGGVEELAIERFRESLSSSEQRMSVHQAHPHTLEQAIQIAMDMEAWQLSEQRRSSVEKGVRFRGVKEEKDDESPLSKVMDKMDSLLELMTKRMSYNKDKKREFKCYSCGKPGHMARNCPSKERESQGEESMSEN